MYIAVVTCGGGGVSGDGWVCDGDGDGDGALATCMTVLLMANAAPISHLVARARDRAASGRAEKSPSSATP